MSKNRFRAIFSMFHFSDNENSSNVDRLYKIKPFLDMMNNKFHRIVVFVTVQSEFTVGLPRNIAVK